MVSVWLFAPWAEQRPVTMPTLDPKTAYEFLRMRRSVRNFKPQAPTDEEIKRLLDVARYAPTAGNSQGMYYVVIRDAEKIKAIADAVANGMEDEVAAGTENKRQAGPMQSSSHRPLAWAPPSQALSKAVLSQAISPCWTS